MRKVFSVALMAAMVCLVGMAKDASATVSFSLVWTSTTGTGVTGTDTISADLGDVLILTLRMTTDQTVAAHGVSINFDTDLGNELSFFNPNGGTEWSGTTYGTTTMAGTYTPATAGLAGVTESTGATGGRLNTYESLKSPSGAFLPTGSYAIGTARFVVTGFGADGPDVWVGLFNLGVDDVLNNLNGVIAPSGLVFGNATVNVIPEPSTAALLGLGLVGLVLAGRRAAARQ